MTHIDLHNCFLSVFDRIKFEPNEGQNLARAKTPTIGAITTVVRGQRYEENAELLR